VRCHFDGRLNALNQIKRKVIDSALLDEVFVNGVVRTHDHQIRFVPADLNELGQKHIMWHFDNLAADTISFLKVIFIKQKQAYLRIAMRQTEAIPLVHACDHITELASQCAQFVVPRFFAFVYFLAELGLVALEPVLLEPLLESQLLVLK
jgi:hypothetical protein